MFINPIGIALWDSQDLEALVQVCWIRWDHLNLPNPSPTLPSHPIESFDRPLQPINHYNSHLPLHNLEPISAVILPSTDPSHQIFLAVLFNSLLERSSKLVILSANTATVLHSIDLTGIGVELRANQRTIVIATKSPLALHLYDYSQAGRASSTSSPTSNSDDGISLVKLPQSPILDLAPKAKTGNPVFHLGHSRLLVYASTKPPNEREPPIATGPGISFVFPTQDLRTPQAFDPTSPDHREFRFGLPSSFSSHRHSSHSGISGTSWKNSVAPNLDAIDETARKLGGGLLNGAKLLSSWGQNFWNPSTDSAHSPRQAFHHPSRDDLGLHFSQSAPLPHMMSAARSPSSTRAGESSASYGNVKVLDLLSTCPKALPHGRHHQSPHPLFHLKISSDPLTFLSLNPSSNLLLTSSIEGHSFHVFELRPHSRVGRSYLNGQHLEAAGSRREATVWHRYKLTRGFTSAEVTDVVWRWDSKVVAVLTEHGTHHLFAIHPAGGTARTNSVENGKPSRGSLDPLSSIFTSRVHNPYIPQPLSVTVSAFEKIKPKPLHHPGLSNHLPSMLRPSSDPPGFGPADYLDPAPSESELHGNPSHYYHTSLVFVLPQPDDRPKSSTTDHEQVLPESSKRSPSVLLHDPATNSVTLYNFEVKRKLLNSVASGVSSSLTKSATSVGTSPDGQQSVISDAQKQIMPNPSGLSQLMQQKQTIEPKVNGQDPVNHLGPGFVSSFALAVWHLRAISQLTTDFNKQLYRSGFSSPSMLVSTSSRWRHLNLSKSTDDRKLDSVIHGSANDQNWTSFVELDTFSHSLRILPRSIYTSHQFDFFNFVPRRPLLPSLSNQGLARNYSFIDQFVSSGFDSLDQKKLTVKREVQIQPGDLGSQFDSLDVFGLSTAEMDDNFVNPHIHPPGVEKTNLGGDHQIYAEPIRSAVEAVLDATLASSPQGSLHTFPEFPNGHPGRKGAAGTHHNSLKSITKSVTSNVGPVVGVVNERMRKEIGKLTSSGVIGEVSRRRISIGLGYYNGISGSLSQRLNRKSEVYDPGPDIEGSTSLSFEDDRDEAIRIDRTLFDDQGPSSSSMTSFTSSNSLTNPNSDELGSDSAARVGQGTRDLEDDEEPESWDGWTFEDDLDFNKPQETKTRSPSQPYTSPDAPTLASHLIDPPRACATVPTPMADEVVPTRTQMDRFKLKDRANDCTLISSNLELSPGWRDNPTVSESTSGSRSTSVQSPSTSLPTSIKEPMNDARSRAREPKTPSRSTRDQTHTEDNFKPSTKSNTPVKGSKSCSHSIQGVKPTALS